MSKPTVRWGLNSRFEHLETEVKVKVRVSVRVRVRVSVRSLRCDGASKVISKPHFVV